MRYREEKALPNVLRASATSRAREPREKGNAMRHDERRAGCELETSDTLCVCEHHESSRSEQKININIFRCHCALVVIARQYCAPIQREPDKSGGRALRDDTENAWPAVSGTKTHTQRIISLLLLMVMAN